MAHGQTNQKRGRGSPREDGLPSPREGCSVGGSPVCPSQPREATVGKAGGSPDNPLPSRGRTFQSASSGAAYVGGICSLSRGGGVNEVSTVGHG